MTTGRMNALAWTAELLGLLVVILGVLSVLPDRFLAAGLLLMVVGILAKLRANKMGQQG
ncbi:hypothetical protein [Corynebacterium kalidii]|jgi:hypothetical protein|uniref:Uncharacterized protein n=1 Tax=Corynebacterium kalidii TaxID=2931982 RepID=A0A9X1WJI4_9CORY|nr:hypothetical protein [Corynebacterium kalidii]MCJ7858727.1 hypothetical protein [Corynebacterium kalidii]